MPFEWSDLRVSKKHSLALRRVVERLPLLWIEHTKSYTITSGNNDEVVAFIQDGGWAEKGGWKKLGNLLSLCYRTEPWARNRKDWIDQLSSFADSLTVSKISLTEVS